VRIGGQVSLVYKSYLKRRSDSTADTSSAEAVGQSATLEMRFRTYTS
jgi:hypothetical protein